MTRCQTEELNSEHSLLAVRSETAVTLSPVTQAPCSVTFKPTLGEG